jgi:hypothetical protein
MLRQPKVKLNLEINDARPEGLGNDPVVPGRRIIAAGTNGLPKKALIRSK